MGKKGAQLTSDAEAAARTFVARVSGLGDVTSKKMFGGVGIFEGGVMFGLVDSGGNVFLRHGPQNEALFEEVGSRRHGKMPYFSVPDTVMENDAAISEWAELAAKAAHSANQG